MLFRSLRMKELALEIARLSKATPEQSSPTMCSLYRYLEEIYGDEQKATQTLEMFLNGTMPQILRGKGDDAAYRKDAANGDQ
jgi:hypothetical protein